MPPEDSVTGGATRGIPIFSRSRGGSGGGGQSANEQIGEFIRTDGDSEVIGLLSGFYQWALNTGADTDPDVSGLDYMNFLDAQDKASKARSGSAGRVQFESERRLLEEQALSESFKRRLLGEQATSEAFNRQNTLASTRLGALQNVDTLRQGGRESAVDALISAAPFIVDPSQQFTPGFEPGGLAEVLSQLLGSNVPNQQLNKETLPLDMLINAPLAGGPQQIQDILASVTAGV